MKRQDALQELNMEKVKERESGGKREEYYNKKGKLDFVGGERMQERAPYNKQVKNGFVWEGGEGVGQEICWIP